MNRSAAAVACAVLFLGAPAARPAESPGKGDARMSRAIDEILRREVFGPAIVAIDVRDLGSGRAVYARNARTNVKPASTTKLLTTAAILDALGPDARVETTLETTARVDALGRVLGDLLFIGRGDPNLSARFDAAPEGTPFARLADELWRGGVRVVEGRLIAHDGLFPGESIGDSWTADDLAWSYGAEISALSAFDNAVRLTILPGERAGDAAQIAANPRTDFIEIENRLVTVDRAVDRAFSATRAPGSRRVVVSGRIPLGASESSEGVAVPEPALFAASLLRDELSRRGVVVRGGLARSTDPLPEGRRVLAFHRGRTVAEEIRVVNKESQNLHAEILLRRLGAAVSKDASAGASLEARATILRQLGARLDEAALYDGSGLSRSSIVSAAAEADLLVAMARHPHANAFRDSLPVAGVDGTLRRRMTGSLAERRVFAKTGGLRHVVGLAGYVDAVSGRRFAFSMIVNHFTRPTREVTAALDEICALLAAR